MSNVIKCGGRLANDNMQVTCAAFCEIVEQLFAIIKGCVGVLNILGVFPPFF